MAFAVVLLVMIGMFAPIFISRSKYKNKKNGVPFFFENQQLVLNSMVPYPIDFSDIDHVELDYSPENLERISGTYIKIIVFKKNGKKRRVFFQTKRFDPKTHPFEMERLLTERGIRCVMP